MLDRLFGLEGTSNTKASLSGCPSGKLDALPIGMILSCCDIPAPRGIDVRAGAAWSQVPTLFRPRGIPTTGQMCFKLRGAWN